MIICPLVWVGCWSLLLLLCYCQFLLLCLLVFVLHIEVLLCWVHKYLQLLCLLLWFIPSSLCTVLLCLLYILCFKVYFVWNSDCHSGFLLVSICMTYLFLSFYFQLVCVSRSEVCLLYTAYIWVLFLYSFGQSASFGWCI